VIAGNWKMNHTAAETAAFFECLNELTRRTPLDQATRSGLKSGAVGALVFPPMLSVARAQELAARAPFTIEIGVQNVHWERKGAFTGEVSGPMLTELGLRWALVGHSERRQHFGETDETVRKRAESLLAQGFQTMVCVGETRAEREAGKTAEVLTRQLAGALPKAGEGAAAFLDGMLVLAYEPVWAIGTGLTASPQQAQEAHALLRGLLRDRFGGYAAEETPILYGGSVTPENAAELLACADVDGALVGGASLKAESFLKLLTAGGNAG
jgi:triosephosphate isomerase